MISLLIDNVRSLYNVGALFRIADGLGIEEIILTGVSGIVRHGNHISLNPKLEKTALEGIGVSWRYAEDPISEIKRLKSDGWQIVSLELTAESIDYRKAEYKSPLVLIIGHERNGVDDRFTQQSDFVIAIPMQGRGKSLNVSVATGIALAEITSQINKLRLR